jgi:uncharacterized protein YegP (UPF0339 family)
MKLRRRLRIFQGKDFNWYFVVVGNNDLTIGLSEGYIEKSSAIATIENYYEGWMITEEDEDGEETIIRGTDE